MYFPRPCQEVLTEKSAFCNKKWSKVCLTVINITPLVDKSCWAVVPSKTTIWCTRVGCSVIQDGIPTCIYTIWNFLFWKLLEVPSPRFPPGWNPRGTHTLQASMASRSQCGKNATRSMHYEISSGKYLTRRARWQHIKPPIRTVWPTCNTLQNKTIPWDRDLTTNNIPLGIITWNESWTSDAKKNPARMSPAGL